MPRGRDGEQDRIGGLEVSCCRIVRYGAVSSGHAILSGLFCPPISELLEH